MSKRIRAAAAGATAVVAGGALMAALGGGASAANDRRLGWPQGGGGGVSAEITTGKMLHLVATDARERYVDVGTKGESPGDYVLLEETLRNEAGKVVGQDSVRCTLLITTFRCDGTFRVNGKGNIEISGAFFPGAGSAFAVLGGTGAYQNARGQGRIVSESGSSTHFVLSLLP